MGAEQNPIRPTELKSPGSQIQLLLFVVVADDVGSRKLAHFALETPAPLRAGLPENFLGVLGIPSRAASDVILKKIPEISRLKPQICR